MDLLASARPSLLDQPARTRALSKPPAISAVGIDTTSTVFRPEDPDVIAHVLRQMDRRGYLSGPGGQCVEMTRTATNFVRVAQPVGPFRLGLYPQHGLFYADARLGAALAGTDDDHSLQAPEHLPTAAELGRDAWRRAGVALTGSRVAIRRLDPAAELRFEDGTDGLRFLRNLGGMTLTKLKRATYDAVDGSRVETVNFFRPKKRQKIGRAYDKGVEAQTHEPGKRIRLEQQMRFDKAKQRQPQDLDRAFVAGEYAKRYKPWREPVDRVVVGDLDALADAIYEREADGRIKPESADGLLGFFAYVSRYGREAYERRYTDRTYRRHHRRARRLGLYLDAKAQKVEATDTARYVGMMIDAWQLSKN